MTETEILAALTDVLREAFGDDTLTVTPETTAKDVPGWDSFKQIEIIMATEERWGMRFTTRDLDGLRCVGDLIAVVAAKGK